MERALSLALLQCADPEIQDLSILSVAPAPDVGRLLVVVRRSDVAGSQNDSLVESLRRLEAVKGKLRCAMAEAAARALKQMTGAEADWSTAIDVDHNHVCRETHFGQEWWVHRKGASSAKADELAIIPGTMGTESYHVLGRGCPESLNSSSHGAGRAMSRHKARQNVSARDLVRQLSGVWINPDLAGNLREEAPAAYKDIRKVMRAQRDLVKIVRRLRPILCHKGT